MKYTIFSIDDSRLSYKNAIRSQLNQGFWWREYKTWCVDGRDSSAVDFLLNEVHEWVSINAKLKSGQLGIWLTLLNSHKDFGDGCFVTFEDDAVLHPAFERIFWNITTRLPKDTHAFSLFLPRDQDQVYLINKEKLDVAPGICRAYQRYGGVSMLWTPEGVNRFKTLVARDGITDQWDDQLYKYAQSGEMNVYTQTPDTEILVSITGTEYSIIQNSEEL